MSCFCTFLSLVRDCASPGIADLLEDARTAEGFEDPGKGRDPGGNGVFALVIFIPANLFLGFGIRFSVGFPGYVETRFRESP